MSQIWCKKKKKYVRCLQQSAFILHQQLQYFPFRRLNSAVRGEDGEWKPGNREAIIIQTMEACLELFSILWAIRTRTKVKRSQFPRHCWKLSFWGSVLPIWLETSVRQEKAGDQKGGWGLVCVLWGRRGVVLKRNLSSPKNLWCSFKIIDVFQSYHKTLKKKKPFQMLNFPSAWCLELGKLQNRD